MMKSHRSMRVRAGGKSGCGWDLIGTLQIGEVYRVGNHRRTWAGPRLGRGYSYRYGHYPPESMCRFKRPLSGVRG